MFTGTSITLVTAKMNANMSALNISISIDDQTPVIITEQPLNVIPFSGFLTNTIIFQSAFNLDATEPHTLKVTSLGSMESNDPTVLIVQSLVVGNATL